jgi:hypothetical protein
MEDTLARARCLGCGKGLSFDEWSGGADRCAACSRSPRMQGPAATYVRGPRPTATATRARQQVADEAAAYERLLDELPDELVDEIVAALEAEAARVDAPAPAQGAFQEVMQDIGFGRSPREWQWAVWGFAGGFTANVLLAKYAQMQSQSPMSQFLAPLLIGGVVAGATCAAIGWGLARLRDR